MMAPTALRRISLDGQQTFAELSGDFNPMHVDCFFMKQLTP